LFVKYDYGEFDTNGNVDATKNSGNIARQTISVTGMGVAIAMEKFPTMLA